MHTANLAVCTNKIAYTKEKKIVNYTLKAKLYSLFSLTHSKQKKTPCIKEIGGKEYYFPPTSCIKNTYAQATRNVMQNF